MSVEQPGYRGALPPRGERMARIWVVLVILGFLSMFVLAALNVPSRWFVEPTPVPVPSGSPAPSESPGESGSASPSPSVSPAESGSPEPTS